MADVPAAAEDVTGEVRSALAPSKPQRTASMRDQTTSQPLIKKHGSSSQNLSLNDYETAATITPPTSDSLVMKISQEVFINFFNYSFQISLFIYSFFFKSCASIVLYAFCNRPSRIKCFRDISTPFFQRRQRDIRFELVSDVER